MKLLKKVYQVETPKKIFSIDLLLTSQLKNCARYAVPASPQEQKRWQVGKYERHESCVYRATEEAIKRGEIKQEEAVKIFTNQVDIGKTLVEHIEGNGLSYSQIDLRKKIIMLIEQANPALPFNDFSFSKNLTIINDIVFEILDKDQENRKLFDLITKTTNLFRKILSTVRNFFTKTPTNYPGDISILKIKKLKAISQ